MLAIDDIVEQVRDERGWSASAAEQHRRAYIAFLSDTGARRRPNAAVDAIWHAHILWTRRYRQDCEALVGHFVDHEPDPAVRRCSSPQHIDDIVGKARCTAPEEAPPSPPPDISRQLAANCTASEPPPPDEEIKPASRHRMADAIGS